MSSIKLFENVKIRSHWDEVRQAWYFSIVDVIAVLTASVDAPAYWRKLKQRLKTEGNEAVTNCHGMEMTATQRQAPQMNPTPAPTSLARQHLAARLLPYLPIIIGIDTMLHAFESFRQNRA
jgi:hypothetical protein